MSIFHLIKYPIPADDISSIREAAYLLPENIQYRVQDAYRRVHLDWEMTRAHGSPQLPELMKKYQAAYKKTLEEYTGPL